MRVNFSYEEGGPVTSVGHFLDAIKEFAGEGDFRLYFRGDAISTATLVPSIGRNHYYMGRSARFDSRTERKLLLQFRRHAYEHFGRIPTEWETLFLARHHGLPTRLLDWTSNPLVALYFAAFHQNTDLAPAGAFEARRATKLEVEGAVWAIQRRPGVEEVDIFHDPRSPLKIPGIKLVLPFNPSPRMTAQSGMFTLHGDPWTDLVKSSQQRYFARDLDISKLVKWNVPSRDKTGIILDLERLAINSRTLFPGLEGLAKGLWETEIIRSCFRNRKTR